MRVCARVLAAALMTGAIAGTIAFPAIFRQGIEPNRLLLVPPASQLRTLPVPALEAPSQYTVLQRRRPAPRTGPSAQAAVRISPSSAGAHRSKGVPTQPVPRPTAPAPPAPEPEPSAPAPPAQAPASSTPIAAAPVEAQAAPTDSRELASAPPPVTTPQPPAPQPDTEDEGDDGHGNGHAHGHDKKDGPGDAGHGNGKEQGFGDD
jgi:hypothetical protein